MMTSLYLITSVKHMSQARSRSKERGLPHESLRHPVLPAIPVFRGFKPSVGHGHVQRCTHTDACAKGMSLVECPRELLLPNHCSLYSRTGKNRGQPPCLDFVT